MDCALILLITAIIAGGVLGALFRGWGVLVRLYRLESGIEDVNKRLVSEVRKRAVDGRWSKADIQRELATIAPAQPVRAKMPWEL